MVHGNCWRAPTIQGSVWHTWYSVQSTIHLPYTSLEKCLYKNINSFEKLQHQRRKKRQYFEEACHGKGFPAVHGGVRSNRNKKVYLVVGTPILQYIFEAHPKAKNKQESTGKTTWDTVNGSILLPSTISTARQEKASSMGSTGRPADTCPFAAKPCPERAKHCRQDRLSLGKLRRAEQKGVSSTKEMKGGCLRC